MKPTDTVVKKEYGGKRRHRKTIEREREIDTDADVAGGERQIQAS